MDVNCYYSAVGLAQHFSGGDAQAYDELFDVLIQKDWAELKTIEFWGSAAGVTGASRQFLDNAAIIPRLFRENPQAALIALQQFGCQNQGTILGAISILMVASAQAIAQNYQLRLPSGNQPGNRFPGLGIGVAVIGGVVVAVSGLVLWDELTRPQLGSNLLEARITPRGNRDWDYLAGKLGIGRNTVRRNLHECKDSAGIPGNADVQVDDETGDIYHQGEHIGNLVEGC